MPDESPEPAPTRPAKLPKKPSRAEQPATTAEAFVGTKPVGTTPAAKTTDAAPAKSPDAPFAAPSGYEFVRRLGEGGMGVVFEARDARDGKSVALKTISDRRTVKMPDVIRFLSEAEVQAAISHENVVRVYKVGEQGGRPYMIMEYLSGGSLADRLADSHPKPKAAAKLMLRIARGVAAAHSRGIFHRDLKPGNILFNDSGEPKVADFGLAKRDTSNLTQTGALMGTPAYMAPEQANGKNALVGAATDVWALGVILYECLTGQRPFKGDSGHIALAITMDEPPSILKKCPDVPRDLERICLKCLEKDPKDRYPSAAELLADLEAQAAGKPIGVKPATWVDRTFKWARKRPTAVAIWGLATLTIVLGSFTAVAISLWQSAKSERNDAVGARSSAESARDQLADQKSTADKLRAEAETAREALGKANYFRVLDLAWRAHLEGNLARAKQLLAEIRGDAKHHGWEWGFVSRRINPESMVFETPPDRTASEKYESLNYTPDGKHVIAVASRPKDRGHVEIARMWNSATGKFENLIPAPGHGEAASVVVTYDGRYALVQKLQPKGDEFGQLHVYDTATAKDVGRLFNALIPVHQAETSPDRKLLAVHYSRQARNESVPLAVPPAPKSMPRPSDAKPPAPAPAPKPKGDFVEESCEPQVKGVDEPKKDPPPAQPLPVAPVAAVPGPAPFGHLIVYDIASSKPVVNLDESSGFFILMGFILDGKELLAEEYVQDGVRLVAWNLRSGQRRVLPPELAGPSGETASVVSRDGTRVAVILKSGKAAVFDLVQNRILREFAESPVEAAPGSPPKDPLPSPRLVLGDFNADGSQLSLWSTRASAIPDGGRLSPRQRPATLVMHDIQSGLAIRTKLFSEFVAPAYSPDGRWRYSGHCAPGLESQFLTLHDDTANRIRAVPTGRFNAQCQLAFAPDSRHMAIIRDDGIAAVDLGASDEAEIPSAGWAPLGYGAKGDEYFVGAHQFGPKASLSDTDEPRGAFTLYDTRTGMLAPIQHVLNAETRFAYLRDGKVHVQEKRGDELIVRGLGELDARSIRLAPGTSDRFLWCAGGRRVFTTGQDGLRFLDAEQGRELWKRTGFSATQRVMIDTSREAIQEMAVPVTTEQEVDGKKVQVTTFRREQQKITYVVRVSVSPPYVSEDGALVAIVPDAAIDRQTRNPIALADTANEVALLESATGKEIGRIPFDTAPTAVVFSPDSKQMAMLCGDRAVIHDVQTRKTLYSLRTPGQFFESLAFSPDGTRFATGNRVEWYGGEDGGAGFASPARPAEDGLRVTFWDAADGREIFTIPIDDERGGGYRAVTRIDFHPQGSQLAVSTTKKTILFNAVAP